MIYLDDKYIYTTILNKIHKTHEKGSQDKTNSDIM